MNNQDIALIDSKIGKIETKMDGHFELLYQKMDSGYKKKRNVTSVKNHGLKAVLFGLLGSSFLI